MPASGITLLIYVYCSEGSLGATFYLITSTNSPTTRAEDFATTVEVALVSAAFTIPGEAEPVEILSGNIVTNLTSNSGIPQPCEFELGIGTSYILC